jgi:hypothetical protein
MKLTVSLFLQSSNSPAELFCCTVEVVTLCGGCCCQKTNEGANDFVAEPMRSLRGRDWRGGRMKVPGPINHECSSSMLTLPSSSECEGKQGLGMTVRLEKELTISQGRTEDEELRKGGWQKKVTWGGKGEVGGGFGWTSGSQPKEEKLGWALGHWTGLQARHQLVRV